MNDCQSTLEPIELVLDGLRGRGLAIRQTQPSAWLAQCPAHDDRRPSLSITRLDNGRVLIHCHAGCSPQAIVDAIGLDMADLTPPNGDWGGRHGRHPGRPGPLGQSCRIVTLRQDVRPPAGVFQTVAMECMAKGCAKAAAELGVSEGVLTRLGVGWSEVHQAWTFPMSNAEGEIIGLRLRSPDGHKWSAKGSKNGLFVPDLLPAQCGDDEKGSHAIGDVLTGINRRPLVERLLICEGPTDTAAALDWGFDHAIGRPNCSDGGEMIVELVRRWDVQDVVILADNDAPGRAGAADLAATLAAYVPTVRVIEPPAGIKDARAWRHAGASKADVEAVIAKTPAITKAVTTQREGR